MKSFLAMLLVLVVSGDDEVTINGTIGEGILLPCCCQNRSLSKEFRWQKQKPNMEKIWSDKSSTGLNYTDKYKYRIKTFHKEHSDNCSLFLSNITAEDQGTYRCSFTQKHTYTVSLVHLNISAYYRVCQHSDTKLQNSYAKTAQVCDVEGRYRDTEVLWYLDQHLLTNSTTTQIFQTPKAPAHHRFSSTIITELNGTSELKCHINARGISAIISINCEGESGQLLPGLVPKSYKRYFKIIPIVSVIGVSLVLLYRWKISRSLPRMKKEEPNYFGS